MTKLQIAVAIANVGLLWRIFVVGKALNNAGGEDAMSDTLETLFYAGTLIVFDLVALIIHFATK